MSRQQLPPGVRKIEGKRRENGRPRVTYELLVDVSKVAGKRKLIRTRKDVNGEPLRTEAAARAELARIQNEVATNQFVQRRRTTVEQACSDWLDSKHDIKPSTLRGYMIWFAPVRQELGHIELQQLTKAHIDNLIKRLRSGEVEGHHVWSARSINGMLGRLQKVIADEKKQGHVHRNVVELVHRLPYEKPEMSILSEAEMFKILDFNDPDRHVWALALYGLRRGELAGLKWSHIDFEARTIEIKENRVTAGKETYTTTPKSRASRRVLPMPDELYNLLKAAHGRIESDYVVCDDYGNPLKGGAISHRWKRMLQRLGIRHRRLHDARHSCGSLMHARNVPIRVISDWLGHASPSFTLNTYVHGGNDALKAAAVSFGRGV